MTNRQRCAVLVFPAILGLLAFVLASFGLRAAPPVPGTPVQFPPQTVEPPLIGQGDADASADPPTPVVRLKVRVPATVAPGQDLVYSIRVENIVRADAHHVFLRNPIPENAKFVRATPEPKISDNELVWDIGTLEGCHYKEITLVLAPTGNGDVRNCARVQFEHGQCTTTRIASPDLSIQKRGPTNAVLGETLDYQIVVTNMSSTDVANLKLFDQLPDGLQHVGGAQQRVWERKLMAPGEMWREDYQVVAKALGKQCNKAIVVAGDIKREAESCVTVVERKVDLDITAPKEAYAGVPTPFQVRLTNKGNDPLTNLVLSAKLPGQSYFVTASGGGQWNGADEVRWTIDNLPAGASRTFQYVLVIQREGEVGLRASVGSTRGVEARAENKVTLGRVQDKEGVYFEVVQEPGSVTVGETTNYLINVVNQGRAALTNVKLTAIVPDEMSTVATKPSKTTVTGQKIEFEPFTLAANSVASYQVQVKAQKDGAVIFEARMSADQRKETFKQQQKTIVPKE